MSRRSDIDALRVLGLLLVFLAHCAVGFVPWAPRMNGAQPSMLVGVLMMWGGLWLMPMFFVLAGATSAFSLERRDNFAYVKERTRQLLIPLLALTVTLVIPTLWIGRRALGAELTFGEFVTHFFDGVFPTGNFGLLHLWFIAYLFIASIVALPLMRAWPRWSVRIADIAEQPLGLLLLALPLVVVHVALSAAFPPPSLPAIVNDATGVARACVLLPLGFVLFREPRLQQAIARQWKPMSVVAVVSSLPTVLRAFDVGFDPARDLPGEFSLSYVAFWASNAIAAWAWIITVLGAGQRFLAKRYRWVERATPLIFSFYVVHQFVVGGALVASLQLRLPSLVAFVAIAVVALPVTLAICALIRLATAPRQGAHDDVDDDRQQQRHAERAEQRHLEAHGLTNEPQHQ